MALRLLRDLARQPERPRTVIVVDDRGVEPPQQYVLAPRRLFGAVIGSVLAVGLVLAALIVFSPVRGLVYGPDPEVLRETARLSALRAEALEDSMVLQRDYLAVLRTAITGMADTAAAAEIEPEPEPEPLAERQLEAGPAGRSEDWRDHEAPALALTRLDGGLRGRGPARGNAAEAYLASLQFPALPPIEGFAARGFDAAAGHFGMDFAVEEGMPVRSIGDGYVVSADWTNDGGYVVAVQHAGGYLSVYKHNRRLLKRIGDRVRSRETVALSGNTGEITTGPHLHFELWRNGLAQDPRLYLVGL